MKLVLASRSPRRRALLKCLGIPFQAVSPRGVAETPRKRESPRSLVIRLAALKAISVSKRSPGTWVLGCDTEVFLTEHPLGKPETIRQSRDMILALSNRTHRVLSGLALVGPDGKPRGTSVVTSRVTFGVVPPREVGDYVKTREPYDKAGGYAIQGTAGKWVKRLEGDFDNVMGLPLTAVWNLLRKNGAFKNLEPRGTRRARRKET